MTETLNFLYLDENSSWPAKKDGNLYFKLIPNSNDKIYGESNFFEMALDLDNNRYFLTPKLADNKTNGLLSSEDKTKIDQINLEKLITTSKFKKEVEIKSLSPADSAQAEWTEEETQDGEKQWKLSLSIPRGESGTNGRDGSDGSRGADGKDGKDCEINENVIVELLDGISEGSATLEKNNNITNKNIYQLSLVLPKAKDGETYTLGDVTINIDDNINATPTGSFVKNNNKYNLMLTLPKKDIQGPIGPAGIQGESGKITNLKINNNNGGNTVNNITTSSTDDGVDGLNISTHNSPVINNDNDVEPQSYSLLYKLEDGTDNYTYNILNPPILTPTDEEDWVLCYNQTSKLTYKRPVNIINIDDNSTVFCLSFDG